MKKFWYAFMLIAVCLVGCNNTDDLEDDINDLKKRVTSLETQIKDLNSNIEAIRELCKEGKTITNIEHADGIYTLTLSDGSTLKLVEKTPALFPLIGINNEGNWQVSYDNGDTYTPILVNGQPVKAKGEDGATPKFRVNDGYWEVSTDGITYTQVKNENGDPVKAVPDESASPEDSFFQKVENKGASLEITLKDGTVVSIPIVKDFFCYFDESYTGIQRIEAGEFKEFDLHIKGAESVSVITAPIGWIVEISDAVEEVAKVKVTAPITTAPLTRAIADNTKDVAILATKGVHAQLTKIQVELGEDIPVIKDYKADYEAGKDITIGHLTINNASGYAMKSLDASTEEIDLSAEIHNVETPTILFLTGTAHNFVTKGGIKIVKTKIILIGQKENEQPAFKPEFCTKLTAGGLALKNIILDMSTLDGTSNKGYFLNNASATDNAEWLVIDDCSIKNIQKPIYNSATVGNGISKVEIQKTKIACSISGTMNLPLINLYNTSNLDTYPEFTFKNNSVYNNSPAKGQIWVWNDNKGAATPTNNNVVNVNISNNTFINFIGTNIFNKFYMKANLEMQKNVFYGANDNYNNTKSSYFYSYYGEGASGTILVNDNIVFDESTGEGTTRSWLTYHGDSKLKDDSGSNKISVLETTPFAAMDFSTGTFTLKAEYSSYGAQ